MLKLIRNSNVNSNLKIKLKLNQIQNKLKILHGSFNEETVEQKLSVKYLEGEERILEIGGNIGRNSLVIASILKNQKNLVVLESDQKIAINLQENKELNSFEFIIEPSALSKRKLIQKGWNTYPSEILQEGFKWIDTITFDSLQKKYEINFDTLVVDCEGAFYYIMLDSPEILENIKLIIIENDFQTLQEKIFVDNILSKSNFNLVHAEAGGWGPCSRNFYEVWKK